MQSFTLLCAKFHTYNFVQENCYCQLIVVLKFIFTCEVFSAKLYAHEMFGSLEFETSTFLGVVPKSICGPLLYVTLDRLLVYNYFSRSVPRLRTRVFTCVAATILRRPESTRVRVEPTTFSMTYFNFFKFICL